MKKEKQFKDFKLKTKIAYIVMVIVDFAFPYSAIAALFGFNFGIKDLNTWILGISAVIAILLALSYEAWEAEAELNGREELFKEYVKAKADYYEDCVTNPERHKEDFIPRRMSWDDMQS